MIYLASLNLNLHICKIVMGCTDSSTLSLTWLLLIPVPQRRGSVFQDFLGKGKRSQHAHDGQEHIHLEKLCHSKMSSGTLGWWSLQGNSSQRRCGNKGDSSLGNTDPCHLRGSKSGHLGRCLALRCGSCTQAQREKLRI